VPSRRWLGAVCARHLRRRQTSRGADCGRHQEPLHAAVEGRSSQRPFPRTASAERRRDRAARGVGCRRRDRRRFIGSREDGPVPPKRRSREGGRRTGLGLATRHSGPDRHAAGPVYAAGFWDRCVPDLCSAATGLGDALRAWPRVPSRESEGRAPREHPRRHHTRGAGVGRGRPQARVQRPDPSRRPLP